MPIAVLGATGRTGIPLVQHLLERGHDVRVLVRDPDALDPALRDRIDVVTGSASDIAALETLLAGDAEAVLSALGPTRGQSDLHTRTARALLTAMPDHGVDRFVGVSGAGIDVPGDRKGVRDRLVSWLIQHLGGSVAQDKIVEHRLFAASTLDWTLVRPPRLVNGLATGRIQHDAHTPGKSTKLRRADLAAFLVDEYEQHRYPRQAPFVCNT